MEQDDSAATDTISLSATARGNIRADIGARAFICGAELPTVSILVGRVLRKSNTLKLESITLYPLPDAKSFEGYLLSDFIHPYFGRNCVPLHEDDSITIKTDIRVATFSVFTAGQSGHGVVTPETRIILWREQDVAVGQYVEEPLVYARKLQKDIDYLSSNWCAESLAGFEQDFMELLNLLETPPPAYTQHCDDH